MPPHQKRSIDAEPKEKNCENERTDTKRTTNKENQKRLTYNKERKAMFKMGNWHRTMDIASLNPDSMKEEQMQSDIIKNLARSKIHISAIQETHIIHDRDHLIDNYRIVEESATKREETGVVQGGTSIMIHGRTQQYITTITRKRRRVLKVTICHQKSNAPIQRITTYAPHNGHPEEDRRHHWGRLKRL